MFCRYFLACMLLILGVGCQSSSQKNSSCSAVRVNLHEEPQSLDPRCARALSSLTLIHMLFDGLMREGKDGVLHGAVAESVDISPDSKVYTFHLKETYWSNGDPVRAQDFAYAWKKRLSRDFASSTADALYVIKNAQAAKEGALPLEAVGIFAPTERELVVELERPTPYFLNLVANPSWAPVHQGVDEANPAWMQHAAFFVSNGPFTLDSWEHQNQLTLNKNPSYWDADAVKLLSIEFPMVAEETELKMFEKGELDWAGSPLSTLPLDALVHLRQTQMLQTQSGLGTDFLRVNVDTPMLSHPLLRRALALCLDRKQLVEHVMQGGQKIATGLVPLCLKSEAEAYFTDGDVEAAKRCFAQALSVLHVQELPAFTYLYRSSERNHLLAQAIQQKWKEVLGLEVRLEGVEPKVFFSRLAKQDYQIAFGSWIGDFPDPVNFLEVFKSKTSGCNNTRWENVRYKELLDRSSESSGVERTAFLREAEKILIEEMPIIPISYMSMAYVVQPRLKGVVLSSGGQLDFKWAHIEEPR